jgi:hypothetical protein
MDKAFAIIRIAPGHHTEFNEDSLKIAVNHVLDIFLRRPEGIDSRNYERSCLRDTVLLASVVTLEERAGCLVQ